MRTEHTPNKNDRMQGCMICADNNWCRKVDRDIEAGMTTANIRKIYHDLSALTVDSHRQHLKQKQALIAAFRAEHFPGTLVEEPDEPVDPALAAARARTVQQALRPVAIGTRLTPAEIMLRASTLIGDAEMLFQAAKTVGSIKDAVRALDAVRKALELCGKFEGIGNSPTVSIDQRQVTILNQVSQLTVDEMRAIAYGVRLPGATIVSEDDDAEAQIA